MSETVAAFIGAIVAGLVAYLISNRDLTDSLDSKSGWREKLFTVASTYELTYDHAQTVRAALRIFPQEGGFEKCSFTWFSNIMIEHLDDYILNNKRDNTKLLTDFDAKIVRLFAMFLLKYHFDYMSSISVREYFFRTHSKKLRNKKYNDLVAETFLKYIKIMQEEM